MNQPIKHPFYARLAYILVSVVLIIFLLEQGKDIFVPLMFGLLVAILVYPVNRFFERKFGFNRGIAAISSITIFVVLLSGFIYFLSAQIINFSNDLPDLKLRFQHIFNDIHHWLTYKMHINTATQNDYINQTANSAVQSAASSISNLFRSLTGILLLVIFIIIFTFFILFHRTLLMNFILNLFSEPHRPKVTEVVVETKTMINSYILGLLIEMLIMGVANTVLLLVLGVQYAVLLGVVAAVLNIIPYLGIYTATFLIAFVTFANSSGNLAIEAAIGMLVLHFLDANILMPRIVGARVKMNPFITIIAVIVGEYIWGIPGMFLFIPIIGMIKLICERVEGLEAWGLLIGVDETPKRVKNKISEEGEAVPGTPTNGAAK